MNAPVHAVALQPVIPLAAIVPSKTNPRKQFDRPSCRSSRPASKCKA
jgi:hypothetical protein